MTENYLGELKVLQKLNKYEFGVELWAMRSGINRNKWNYQNIDKHYLTFVGQPILCAFPKGQIGDGHNSKMVKDPETGEEYYSYLDGSCERIVGTLSDDPKDFRLEELDGETWIVAKGRLFAFYSRELVEHIVEAGVMEVSAETAVFESHNDGDIEVFTEWEGLGVTILNEKVPPAIPGARIEELAAMRKEFNELCLKAASYNNEQEESEELPADETNDKPHTNNPNGGLKKLKAISKKQLAELATKFDGYFVLSASKDEAGIHCCLMSAEGVPAVYTMESMDDIVAPNKIERVAVMASFDFGNDIRIEVDSCELTDRLSASLVTANSNIENLQRDLDAANATISTMSENEKARRVQAAKDKAVDTLSKFNEHREEKIEDDILVAVNSAIDNGDYTDSVTEAGLWNGEERVSKEVLALCASKVMEMDEAAAQSAKKQYVWEGAPHGESEEGISALLKRFGVD